MRHNHYILLLTIFKIFESCNSTFLHIFEIFLIRQSEIWVGEMLDYLPFRRHHFGVIFQSTGEPRGPYPLDE